MTEVWKPIWGYTGLYEVSNLGRVRSLDRIASDGRRVKGRVLRVYYRPGHYGSVMLSKAGVEKRFEIHGLVARAFLGPRPKGKLVLHGELGQHNDSVTNLRYGTYSENAFDMYRDGTMTLAKPVRCSNGKVYRSQREAARELGLRQSHISQVCNGTRKSTGGFTWEFV